MPGLDTVIAVVGAATAVISVGVALAAFRRSGPRVQVSTGDLSATRGVRDRIRGTGQLEISFHVANTGDKPVRISGVRLFGLAPLPHGSAPGLIVIDSGLGRKFARKVVVTRRARHLPLGRFRPVRVLRRRSARWQEYAEQLDLPTAEALTVSPFDGHGITAPVSWATGRSAHWLRLEVRLATGATLWSRWWRNRQDIVELYEDEVKSRPAVARSARVLGDRVRLLVKSFRSARD